MMKAKIWSIDWTVTDTTTVGQNESELKIQEEIDLINRLNRNRYYNSRLEWKWT